jgi:hypothetical protein
MILGCILMDPLDGDALHVCSSLYQPSRGIDIHTTRSSAILERSNRHCSPQPHTLPINGLITWYRPLRAATKRTVLMITRSVIHPFSQQAQCIADSDKLRKRLMLTEAPLCLRLAMQPPVSPPPPKKNGTWILILLTGSCPGYHHFFITK